MITLITASKQILTKKKSINIIACGIIFFLGTTAHAVTYTIDYSYDKAGQLTAATLGEDSEISYQYDATGNLLKIAYGIPILRKPFFWPMFLPAIINNSSGYQQRIPNQDCRGESVDGFCKVVILTIN